ncbi:MAG: hypothetical protein LBJ01_12200, partial [Tannerella sp.]|nr:hypothetical protein [Tannerella sp.]
TLSQILKKPFIVHHSSFIVHEGPSHAGTGCFVPAGPLPDTTGKRLIDMLGLCQAQNRPICPWTGKYHLLKFGGEFISLIPKSIVILSLQFIFYTTC